MTVRATDNELTREQAKEQLKAHQHDLELAKEREQGLSEETQQLNKEWARINAQLIGEIRNGDLSSRKKH